MNLMFRFQENTGLQLKQHIFKIKDMKIAIIGTGNLGKSIAKGLIQNKSFSQLFLTKRNIEELNEFKKFQRFH